MNKLQLVLKRKWFDMILSGEKPEEYRNLTNYWLLRLTGDTLNYEVNNEDKPCPDDAVYSTLIHNADLFEKDFKNFESVIFYMGYAKERPRMEVEFKGIEIAQGKTKWGADPKKYYFVIKLGKIFNTKNC